MEILRSFLFCVSNLSLRIKYGFPIFFFFNIVFIILANDFIVLRNEIIFPPLCCIYDSMSPLVIYFTEL